jgi:hypothetical protein
VKLERYQLFFIWEWIACPADELMAKKQIISYDTPVFDKNDKALGKISSIILDTWSGEPRKYVIRLSDHISALYFKPQHIAEATETKVKLNIALEEMEST